MKKILSYLIFVLLAQTSQAEVTVLLGVGGDKDSSQQTNNSSISIQKPAVSIEVIYQLQEINFGVQVIDNDTKLLKMGWTFK